MDAYVVSRDPCIPWSSALLGIVRTLARPEAISKDTTPALARLK